MLLVNVAYRADLAPSAEVGSGVREIRHGSIATALCEFGAILQRITSFQVVEHLHHLESTFHARRGF